MIVLYKGARGKGKTLTMVKDAFRYYKNGYKILSNFTVGFGESINSNEVLALNKESDLFNCVLVLDELQLFFDSRNFNKKENKSFSNFIQQIRKRNIIILGTTQYSNTVELRFRQHIDIVAIPVIDSKLNICGVRYFDLSKFEDLDFETYESPPTIFFDSRPLYDLYDTNEMLV